MGNRHPTSSNKAAVKPMSSGDKKKEDISLFLAPGEKQEIATPADKSTKKLPDYKKPKKYTVSPVTKSETFRPTAMAEVEKTDLPPQDIKIDKMKEELHEISKSMEAVCDKSEEAVKELPEMVSDLKEALTDPSVVEEDKKDCCEVTDNISAAIKRVDDTELNVTDAGIVRRGSAKSDKNDKSKVVENDELADIKHPEAGEVKEIQSSLKPKDDYKKEEAAESEVTKAAESDAQKQRKEKKYNFLPLFLRKTTKERAGNFKTEESHPKEKSKEPKKKKKAKSELLETELAKKEIQAAMPAENCEDVMPLDNANDKEGSMDKKPQSADKKATEDTPALEKPAERAAEENPVAVSEVVKHSNPVEAAVTLGDDTDSKGSESEEKADHATDAVQDIKSEIKVVPDNQNKPVDAELSQPVAASMQAEAEQPAVEMLAPMVEKEKDELLSSTVKLDTQDADTPNAEKPVKKSRPLFSRLFKTSSTEKDEKPKVEREKKKKSKKSDVPEKSKKQVVVKVANQPEPSDPAESSNAQKLTPGESIEIVISQSNEPKESPLSEHSEITESLKALPPSEPSKTFNVLPLVECDVSKDQSDEGSSMNPLVQKEVDHLAEAIKGEDSPLETAAETKANEATRGVGLVEELNIPETEQKSEVATNFEDSASIHKDEQCATLENQADSIDVADEKTFDDNKTSDTIGKPMHKEEHGNFLSAFLKKSANDKPRENKNKKKHKSKINEESPPKEPVEGTKIENSALSEVDIKVVDLKDEAAEIIAAKGASMMLEPIATRCTESEKQNSDKEHIVEEEQPRSEPLDNLVDEKHDDSAGQRGSGEAITVNSTPPKEANTTLLVSHMNINLAPQFQEENYLRLSESKSDGKTSKKQRNFLSFFRKKPKSKKDGKKAEAKEIAELQKEVNVVQRQLESHSNDQKFKGKDTGDVVLDTPNILLSQEFNNQTPSFDATNSIISLNEKMPQATPTEAPLVSDVFTCSQSLTAGQEEALPEETEKKLEEAQHEQARNDIGITAKQDEPNTSWVTKHESSDTKTIETCEGEATLTAGQQEALPEEAEKQVEEAQLVQVLNDTGITFKQDEPNTSLVTKFESSDTNAIEACEGKATASSLAADNIECLNDGLLEKKPSVQSLESAVQKIPDDKTALKIDLDSPGNQGDANEKAEKAQVQKSKPIKKSSSFLSSFLKSSTEPKEEKKKKAKSTKCNKGGKKELKPNLEPSLASTKNSSPEKNVVEVQSGSIKIVVDSPSSENKPDLTVEQDTSVQNNSKGLPTAMTECVQPSSEYVTQEIKPETEPTKNKKWRFKYLFGRKSDRKKNKLDELVPRKEVCQPLANIDNSENPALGIEQLDVKQQTENGSEQMESSKNDAAMNEMAVQQLDEEQGKKVTQLGRLGATNEEPDLKNENVMQTTESVEVVSESAIDFTPSTENKESGISTAKATEVKKSKKIDKLLPQFLRKSKKPKQDKSTEDAKNHQEQTRKDKKTKIFGICKKQKVTLGVITPEPTDLDQFVQHPDNSAQAVSLHIMDTCNDLEELPESKQASEPDAIRMVQSMIDVETDMGVIKLSYPEIMQHAEVEKEVEPTESIVPSKQNDIEPNEFANEITVAEPEGSEEPTKAKDIVIYAEFDVNPLKPSKDTVETKLILCDEVPKANDCIQKINPMEPVAQPYEPDESAQELDAPQQADTLIYADVNQSEDIGLPLQKETHTAKDNDNEITDEPLVVTNEVNEFSSEPIPMATLIATPEVTESETKNALEQEKPIVVDKEISNNKPQISSLKKKQGKSKGTKCMPSLFKKPQKSKNTISVDFPAAGADGTVKPQSEKESSAVKETERASQNDKSYEEPDMSKDVAHIEDPTEPQAVENAAEESLDSCVSPIPPYEVPKTEASEGELIPAAVPDNEIPALKESKKDDPEKTKSKMFLPALFKKPKKEKKISNVTAPVHNVDGIVQAEILSEEITKKEVKENQNAPIHQNNLKPDETADVTPPKDDQIAFEAVEKQMPESNMDASYSTSAKQPENALMKPDVTQMEQPELPETMSTPSESSVSQTKSKKEKSAKNKRRKCMPSLFKKSTKDKKLTDNLTATESATPSKPLPENENAKEDDKVVRSTAEMKNLDTPAIIIESQNLDKEKKDKEEEVKEPKPVEIKENDVSKMSNNDTSKSVPTKTVKFFGLKKPKDKTTAKAMTDDQKQKRSLFRKSTPTESIVPLSEENAIKKGKEQPLEAEPIISDELQVSNIADKDKIDANVNKGSERHSAEQIPLEPSPVQAYPNSVSEQVEVPVNELTGSLPMTDNGLVPTSNEKPKEKEVERSDKKEQPSTVEEKKAKKLSCLQTKKDKPSKVEAVKKSKLEAETKKNLQCKESEEPKEIEDVSVAPLDKEKQIVLKDNKSEVKENIDPESEKSKKKAKKGKIIKKDKAEKSKSPETQEAPTSSDVTVVIKGVKPPRDKSPGTLGNTVKIYPCYDNVAAGSDVSKVATQTHQQAWSSTDVNLGDIKVYRRCPGGVQGSQSMTLPSRLRRNKSPVGASNGSTPRKDYPELGRRAMRWDSFSDSRSSARASNNSSTASICYKVTKDDFPSTSSIKRSVRMFEDEFVRSFTHRYTSLSSKQQLSLLAIAIKIDKQSSASDQTVSLHDYITSKSIPHDLGKATTKFTAVRSSAGRPMASGASPSLSNEYVMFISDAQFDLLLKQKQADRKKSKASEDVSEWQSLARDIVISLTADAGSELSRMYEYHIGLITEDAAIKLLAEHAADTALKFLTVDNFGGVVGVEGDEMGGGGGGGGVSEEQGQGPVRYKRYLDKNSIVRGVVSTSKQVCPPSPMDLKCISVIIGQRELKWNISEVFCQPGLRKETLIFTDDLDPDDPYPPWTFHTSDRHNPMIYGYRTLWIEWDFYKAGYKVAPEEDAQYIDEMLWRHDDFHRLYAPYHRLVGSSIMQSYARHQIGGSLADYLQQLHGETNARDEIAVVYRPLVSVWSDTKGVDLSQAEYSPTIGQNDKSYIPFPPIVHVGTSPSRRDIVCIDEEELIIPVRREEKLHAVQMHVEPLKESVESKDDQKADDNEKKDLEKPIETKPMEINKSNVKKATEKITVDGKEKKVGNLTDLAAEKGVVEKPEKLGKMKPEIKTKPTKEELKTEQERKKKEKLELENKRKKEQEEENDRKKIEKKQEAQKRKQKKKEEADLKLKNRKQAELEAKITKKEEIPTAAEVSEKQAYNEDRKTAVITGEASLQDQDPSQPTLHSRGSRPTPHYIGEYRGTTTIIGPVLDVGGRAVNCNIPPDMTTLMPKSRLGFLGAGALEDIEIRAAHLKVDEERETQHVMDIKGFVEEKAEAEEKSKLCKALFLPKIGYQLPDSSVNSTSSVIGHETEIEQVLEAVLFAGSFVTLTGCHGIGKSAIAMSVGHILKSTRPEVTCVVVESHGACNVESFVRRLVKTFDTQFRIRHPSELSWFYTWLKAHDQKLIIIIDNIDNDLCSTDGLGLLEILEDMLHEVPKLSLLCTAVNELSDGGRKEPLSCQDTARVMKRRSLMTNVKTIHITDLRQHSQSLFLQLAPDVSDEDIQKFSDLCCNVPLAIRLVANLLSLTGMDPSSLYKSITSYMNHPSMTNISKWIESLSAVEEDRRALRATAICVLAFIKSSAAGKLFTDILQNTCNETTWFDINFLNSCAVINPSSPEIQDSLTMLTRLGMLKKDNYNNYCYVQPVVVKTVVQEVLGEERIAKQRYCTLLKRLTALCKCYHSREHNSAVYDLEKDSDNFLDSLNKSAQCCEEYYDITCSLASLEGAMFLSEFFPATDLIQFYTTLERVAEQKADVCRRSRCLCCITYIACEAGNVGVAAHSAVLAYTLLSMVDDIDKAFCFYCIAKVYWHDTSQCVKSLILAKNALDLFTTSSSLTGGGHDVKVIYAAEFYAYMLAQTGYLQMSLHVFNESDKSINWSHLEGHPQLIKGYDCRRAVWDKLGLYSRARTVATRHKDAVERYYGMAHPLTATACMSLCVAVIRKGFLNDAILNCVNALSIRLKTLDDNHIDTALSYLQLAQLMLRSSYTSCNKNESAAAIRFTESARDIFRRRGQPAGEFTGLQAETANLLERARSSHSASQRPCETEAASEEHTKLDLVQQHDSAKLSGWAVNEEGIMDMGDDNKDGLGKGSFARGKNVTFQEIQRSKKQGLTR